MQHAESNKQPVSRQSNIELLRIIAMVIIVAHHFSYHGGFEFSANEITFNRLYMQFIQIGGKIGADIFVLISGYFLITAKSLKTGKVIKLWLQIFTYSALIFITFAAFGIRPFGVEALIRHCFPVTFTEWWFASTYFVLYLLSPYINKLLNAFDKKEYQRFLVLLTICWCIIPTFTTQAFQSNGLLWFGYLYALAGYIKLYGSRLVSGKLPVFSLSVVFIFLTFLSVVFFDILGTKISLIKDSYTTYFYGMQKLPVLIISVLLFIGFLRINIGYRRIINIISSATFGVYLIHDNLYVSPFLWKTVFPNAAYSNSNMIVPYSLMVIAVVFIACTLIELARMYLFEKHYIGFVNTLADVIDRYKEKLLALNFFDKI